jgi:hypothetical protein
MCGCVNQQRNCGISGNDIYVFMSAKQLSIIWSDGSVSIDLFDNPVAEWYHSCIRRLQHVDLQFSPRHNPLLLDKLSREDLCSSLLGHGWDLGLDIDSSWLGTQQYRNELHEHYRVSQANRDSNPAWTQFHDTLHLLEDKYNSETRRSIWFDYGHRAGPLIRPFDRSLLRYATHTGTKGHCYIRPHELGKDLYRYWCDGEDGTMEDFLRIAEPWRFLKPVLSISREDIPEPAYPAEFLQWLKEREALWCQHHHMEDWSIRELSARLPIGQIHNIDELIRRFQRAEYPKRIVLSV